MHIPQPNSDFLDAARAEQELTQLLAQPGAQELRPCPNCPMPCDSEQPAQCAVSCDSNCTNAPAALSSEPGQHPIEQHVVKIVFELSTLRLIQPCWSCEGHLNGQGELWKLPQISFYSASPLYAQLFLNTLTRLKNERRLHYPWQITLVNYGQTWAPTYQMEAALNQITDEIQLNLLQQDLYALADRLAERIKQEARIMLDQIKRG